MSLVIRVQRSLPWAHACDESIVSSSSEAASNASIVAIVCSSSSRTAPRTVAAIDVPPVRGAGRSVSSTLPWREKWIGPGWVIGDVHQHRDFRHSRTQQALDALPDGNLGQTAPLTTAFEPDRHRAVNNVDQYHAP